MRKRMLALGAAALASWTVGASAGPAYQHSHSLESGVHDVRELGVAIRRRASEPVGWRDEKGMHDPLARVKLIGFNDFHGRLAADQRVANRPVGGIGVFASYLKSAAEQARDGYLFIHAGDHVGATPPDSALLQDEPSIQFLNLLTNDKCRYADPRRVPWWVLTFSQPRCNVVGTLGNHEFDEGVAEMLRLIGGGNHAKGPFLEAPYRGARYTYVSANVVRRSDRQPILPPYVVRQVGGEHIAVIGAVLKETPTIVTPSGVAGVDFLDEAHTINKYARFLNAIGVRTIIVTIHQGIRQAPTYTGPTNPAITGLTGPIVDITRQLDSSVDVVISGHAHGFTNALIVSAAGHPILVTQAFSASTAYDDIDLAISRKTGDVVEKSGAVVTTWGDEGPGLTPDADAAALALAADVATAPLRNRVVGAVDLDAFVAYIEEDLAGNVVMAVEGRIVRE